MHTVGRVPRDTRISSTESDQPIDAALPVRSPGSALYSLRENYLVADPCRAQRADNGRDRPTFSTPGCAARATDRPTLRLGSAVPPLARVVGVARAVGSGGIVDLEKTKGRVVWMTQHTRVLSSAAGVGISEARRARITRDAARCALELFVD